MKLKNNKGFVAIDTTIAVIAVIIFSILIISLIYNNSLENLKIKREALATIYLTETLENISIAAYEDVTQENIESFIPSDLASNNYNMEINISSDLELTNTKNEDIMKKVTATISYEFGNKTYSYSIQRNKIKE